MTIKAGERMPAGKFKLMGESGPQDLTTAQLFDCLLYTSPSPRD